MNAQIGVSRTQLILIVLLASVLVILAFFQSQPETTEPYDPEDAGSMGVRALVLWLEELGHSVSLHERETVLADDVGLAWVHTSPNIDYSYMYEDDVTMLYDWVDQGGTLVLIGPQSYSLFSDLFGVEQEENFTDIVLNARQAQPLLPDVPTDWTDFATARSLYFWEERAYIPVLAHNDGTPVVAVQFIGDGVVWHLTEDFALTNLNLREDRVASLLPAILRTVPAGAPAVFTTLHLSTHEPVVEGEGTINTMQDWLYTTPFGQATLLVMIATLGYLILQGRRLGPALPGPTANRPREAAEYVTALAGLQRRLRQPSHVAAHHRQRLKHAVGRLAQTPADLADQEWLAQLYRTEALPPATLNQISEILAGFAEVDAKTKDEDDLIELVQATDALLASLPRANMQLVR